MLKILENPPEKYLLSRYLNWKQLDLASNETVAKMFRCSIRCRTIRKDQYLSAQVSPSFQIIPFNSYNQMRLNYQQHTPVMVWIRGIEQIHDFTIQ